MADIYDNSLKRPLDTNEDILPEHTSHIQLFKPQQAVLTPPSSIGSAEKHDMDDIKAHVVRELSPAPSSTTLSSLPASTIAGSIGQCQSDSNKTSEPVRKRRKLTVEEKEEQRKEREEKARLREQKRVQKEAENALKDEERRAKAEERRAKNEEKENKQREKDLVKRQKEEEQAKKQRAQLRLGAFFTNHSSPSSKPGTTPPLPSVPPETAAASRAPDVETVPEAPSATGEAAVGILKPSSTDYQKFFLPFELPSHASWAPLSIVHETSEALKAAQECFDEFALTAKADAPLQNIFNTFPARINLDRPARLSRAADIMQRLQGTQDNPHDLTESSAEDALKTIDIKHIHFCEDVRPPYTGSFTKITSPRRARKFARQPFSRARDDTNYDYDSEGEWEEPEEGEDIMSDGEDDAESTASADEMEGFLDDGDDLQAARKLITSELQPISSGICWEGAIRTSTSDSDPNLRPMRLEWLLEQPVKSINPYSASYWEEKTIAPPVPEASNEPVSSATVQAARRDIFGNLLTPARQIIDGAMKPPSRTPGPSTTSGVKGKTILGAKSGEKGPIIAVAGPRPPKTAAAPLTGSRFDDFRDAVDGSNLTKVELLRALKQRFPDITNSTIKETLESRFERAGATAAEKKWRLATT